jgi:succinyldiaminopimelate transaminase
LSVGTPVDPTPSLIQQALRDAADAPGYPTTAGTADLRAACADWLARRHGVQVSPDAVLPVIGSKECIAGLPTLLGMGGGQRVGIPRIAYPTYAVGAVVAGCESVVMDDDVTDVDLIWVNSPSNPTGAVTSVPDLRAQVQQARTTGAIIASDECYIELGWDVTPISILHPDVVGADHTGVLAVHSLSKRSNMAGYRFGFITGDPRLIRGLLETRKHHGLMVPAPIQAAATVAFTDDAHVERQRERYRRRRSVLWAALESAGFQIDESVAGLYLWATRGDDCWDTVRWFADRGILVTPGDFYGPAGARHVRVALTASDPDVDEAARRLTVA